ncbi:MAG: PKD domain-containing protein [Bacteroidota bacterium]
MNYKIYSLLLISLFAFSKMQAQCSSSYIYSYTGITNFVWFQDKSIAPTNWQREYTHWNFNDGSSTDTNKTATHTFPQAQTYNVVKETRFSEIGNPSNFCIAKDSLLINAALSTSSNVCIPHVEMKVKWLSGLTYGVSNFVSNGCPYNYREIVADTGSTFMPGGGVPMPGIFTTQHYYFTYNVAMPQFNNTITHHINYPNPQNFGGTEDYHYIVTLNTTNQTPNDCHASFFMQPSDSTLHNWTLQDYSSSAGTASYFWDFGDGSTSTLASPTHTYASIGMYTICMTVSSGTCSDTYCETAFVDTTINGAGIHSINVQKMMVTGISENKKQQQSVLLFPNPAQNSIEVSYPFEKDNYTISVTNLLGQNVWDQAINNVSTESVKLNIEDLQSGIYFLQIHSDSGTTLAKTRFIKE